jgi:hypothetical protein
MGRWPGTTREVELTDSYFTTDSETGETFVWFEEGEFDGAIGFRNRERGWSIVDHTALYKDGVNMGDLEFVDMGTVEVDLQLQVEGELTYDGDPLVFPLLSESSDGLSWVSSQTWETPYFAAINLGGLFGAYWILEYQLTEGDTAARWSSTEDVASPDLVTTWTTDTLAGGDPIVNFTGIASRKYRCPLNWHADNGPFYALMKLEAPTLEDDDIIPVQSLGALKCAIVAVVYENVNDEDRANLNWQKFDTFINSNARQVNGPKRFTVGMDSSLRRKPRQFQ